MASRIVSETSERLGTLIDYPRKVLSAFGHFRSRAWRGRF